MLRRAALCFAFASSAFSQPKTLNPVVRDVAAAVSERRIAEIMKKLESFRTRDTLSNPDLPARGIGAARKWIHDELKSYSPRLEVRYDSYRLKEQLRISHEIDLVNVIAVLPGKIHPEKQVMICGHYDSLNARDASTPEMNAPGVNDNASGTAAVMELARVMSHFDFDKTIVFAAFAGEEQLLIGSNLYASKAKRERDEIEAVLNNDIIGSEIAGNGMKANGWVRVFSEDPPDSPSRGLALYFKRVGERYLPSMRVQLVFRPDRFGRAGDHVAFNQQGFPAVRITAAAEDFAHQHSSSDTFANASPSYAASVTRLNAAVLASLALAPSAPRISAEPKRGASQYDAELRWDNAGEESIAGYAVVTRSTTSPYWERETYVGKVSEYRLENVSIDDTIFGVKAIDRQGNESLVSPFLAPRPGDLPQVETLPPTTASTNQ